jgi:dimethylargininase
MNAPADATPRAPLALPARVLVRPVSESYAACLRVAADEPISVVAARAQHGAYVAAVASAGVPVTVVDADDACADACFVEDTAVVTGRHAIATRPGAPSRRTEVRAVAEALAPFVTVHGMASPATLDGGDVLRAGAALYVGLSSRTNREGAARLAEVAAMDGLVTHVLQVASGLHLKSACTLVDAATLIYDPAQLDAGALEIFRASGLACLAALEPEGANVLALGPHVLASAAAPRTASLLEARGHRVVRVDVSEIHKGEGALTSHTLRIPPQGGVTT